MTDQAELLAARANRQQAAAAAAAAIAAKDSLSAKRRPIRLAALAAHEFAHEGRELSEAEWTAWSKIVRLLGDAATADAEHFLAAVEDLNCQGKQYGRDAWRETAGIARMAIEGASVEQIAAELKSACGNDWRMVAAVCGGFLQLASLADENNQSESAGGVDQAQATTPAKKRPCFDRDHLFLRWKRDGLTPAKIRNKWNHENRGDTIGNGEDGRQTVIKGIKRAIEDEQLSPSA